MKITLNTNQTPFVFVPGVHDFTFSDPGPIDVNLKDLTEEQFNQLLSQVRRGHLVSDNPKGFQTFRKEKTTPIFKEKEVSTEEILAKLLRENVSTLKKKIPELNTSWIQKLLEIEISGKNRKSVVQLCQTILQKHQAEVAAAVKSGISIEDLAKDSNVVDSEEKTVEVQLP